MDAARRFVAIVLADLRERSRSTRFWVLLAGVGIATWWLFPSADAGYVTVGVGDARGLYSSAWVGMVLGLLYASTLTLFGFYIVRGTLSRDFETRVWQLLVATPMTRPGYLLAKWASHLCVFSVILLLGLVVGVAAQLHHGESMRIDPWQLVLPSLVFALPALALTAFLAVLFDMLPWLRRSGGNVLYFFLWIFVFISVDQNFEDGGVAVAGRWLSSPSGMALAMGEIQGWLAVHDPGRDVEGFSIGMSIMEGGIRTFAWDRWQPSLPALLGRAAWLLVAAAGVLALSPALDWAAARTEARGGARAERPGLRLRWLDLAMRPLEFAPAGRLVAAEAKLVLRQRRLTWWLAMAVLWAVQAFAPEKGVAVATILAWLFCVDIFARGALRERETGTASLVFSAAGAGRRVLLARLAFAVALAWAVVLPAWLRSLGDDAGAAGALLITGASVALAGLALAVACRSPRPFELGLVFLAYLGLQGDPLLNALAEPAATLGRHAWLLPASIGLLAVAWPLGLRRR